LIKISRTTNYKFVYTNLVIYWGNAMGFWYSNARKI